MRRRRGLDKGAETYRVAEPGPFRRHATGSRAAVREARRKAPIRLGGLEHYTGYVVRRAQMWIFQDFKRALKDLDVTPAQYSVMRVVGANPGLAQARVAEVLGIERARLVQMLDRLEARGLMARTPSATDRRSHALRLMPEGTATLERLAKRIEDHERNVVARIGPDGKRDLMRILGAFLR